MPRFPFKRSVGQDLRDLFTHDRLKQQERGLGYSSISPGEGSAEVLDASGNTLAHFGHAAGKAGFLIPNGSGWQTIQEHVAAAESVLTGRLDDHAQRIGAAEGDITTLEGRADSHATRIGAAEGDIDALETGKVGFDIHNALAGRVGAAEGDIADIKDGTATLSDLKIGNMAYYGAQHPVGLKIPLVRTSDGRVMGYVDSPFQGS